MKNNKSWGLQKIQEQGIVDNAFYPAESEIVFTTGEPLTPVIDQNKSNDASLSLLQHEEAWWIINQSDEYCCTINDQIMEPHRRMRLNEGDIIEWGLSSWRLVRNGTYFSAPPTEEKTTQSTFSSETITEYLDLDWFRHQHLNPQNPFDIIPIHGAVVSTDGLETTNTLTRLYQEYRQALLAPEQDIHPKSDPFPFDEAPIRHDLTSLHNLAAEASTLQDMVSGGLGIDTILDALDTTGEGETPWPIEDSPPDILKLLSPEYMPEAAHTLVLPDLTQREHRLIGIDSHYRINPAQQDGATPHEEE